MTTTQKPRSCETALVISLDPKLAPIGTKVWMTPAEAHLMLMIGYAMLPKADDNQHELQQQAAPQMSEEPAYRRKYRRYDHREMRVKK